MRYLFPITLLVMLFCSGFTWGKAKEERCKEANELVFNQQAKNPDSLPADLERKVAELCPGGAAEKFLSGLKSELSNQTDQSDAGLRKRYKNRPTFFLCIRSHRTYSIVAEQQTRRNGFFDHGP